MPTDTRSLLCSKLQAIVSAPLRQASLNLLSTLGYQSDKTVDLGKSKPQAFLDLLAQSNPEAIFDQKKAIFGDWTSADLLFQLTDDELSGETSLFQESDIRPSLLKSYLFFAVELNGKSAVNGTYARGKLTAIARQINRVFPMPVMVLIKHPEQAAHVLSIAVINRRSNKREQHKDVLGKVTIIRDISLTDPHRGHLDILDSFAFDNLVHPEKKIINSFDALHTAWERIFNVELLNKSFYDELANWFFWAKKHVHFPLYDEKADRYDLFHDTEKAREHEAKNLIRLLTRTLFVWFIKERGLVPVTFFSPVDLKTAVLKTFDQESSDTNYYKAVLQNLFFATLNQTHGEREFRKEGQHQNTTTLLRYKNRLNSPDDFLQTLENSTPFLNGGLFECLDRPHPTKKGPQGGRVIIYEDGFSDRKDNPLILPDFLFFGKPRTEDLSGDDCFGIASKRNAKVRGLIHILDNYKFTIVENTPIDQEIALDPELLGQVFENLLASYNPETKTTARKQTGSFYTPRPIVDYMVDESLKAHLKRALIEDAVMKADDAEAGLELLFAYTEREHLFSTDEKDVIIQAIDSCKILDPACGSGAFPMGVLQKLVHVLSKLDPGDELWEKRQLAKVDKMIEAAYDIDDTAFRERAIADAQAQKNDIKEAFAKNELGYGRKLYLIENCLYGVDIQSIATQVTKLRFFISLIVDQKVDRQRANFGVRPLPNLETKFVTANSLIRIERPKNQGELFEIAEVSSLQRELKQVRHSLFSAKTPSTKDKYRERDKKLREAITEELKEIGWASDSAEKLAAWDPYDQNASARYFDPEWMFGLEQFDIVIGNPPYLKERDNKHIFSEVIETAWGKKHHVGKMDYWFFFLHRSFEFTKKHGIVAFITSRYWINSTGAKRLIKAIQEQAYFFHAVDIGSLPVFEAVAGHHMVHFHQVGSDQTDCIVKSIEESVNDIGSSIATENLKIWKQTAENLYHGGEVRLKSSSIKLPSGSSLGDHFLVSQGVVQNPDKVSKKMAQSYGLAEGAGVFVLEDKELKALSLLSSERSYVKPFFEDAAIQRFHLDKAKSKQLIYITKRNCPNSADIPNLEKHLSVFRPIMDARRETKKGSILWFQMHWPRDPAFFESPKVAIPSMFDRPRAAYIEGSAYFGIGANVITQGDSNIPLRTLSAFLNSSVGAWWFAINGKQRGVGVDIGVSKLRQFHLPPLNEKAFLLLAKVVELVEFVKSVSDEDADLSSTSFLEDLIDACVMECYFQEHMAERNLLFLDELIPSLEGYDLEADEEQHREFLEHFIATHNAPSAKIRNRLLRISADSPELLAVIKQEGKV